MKSMVIRDFVIVLTWMDILFQSQIFGRSSLDPPLQRRATTSIASATIPLDASITGRESSLHWSPSITSNNVLLQLRGGDQSLPSNTEQNSYSSPSSYPETGNNIPIANSQNKGYEGGFANYNPPSGEAFQQQSVQDRIQQWRTEQVQHEESRTTEDELNPRDNQGRMKLLATVSKGSRAFIFFVLMWRDIHLFEVADSSLKGIVRLMTVTPLTILLLANMVGAVASLLQSNSHAAKKRMKAILNLNKLVEGLILIPYYLVRMTLFPNKYVPREVYISCVLHSVFFLIQCQAFTRLTWDDMAAKSGTIPPLSASMMDVDDEQDDHYQDDDTVRYFDGYEQPQPMYVSNNSKDNHNAMQQRQQQQQQQQQQQHDYSTRNRS